MKTTTFILLCLYGLVPGLQARSSGSHDSILLSGGWGLRPEAAVVKGVLNRKVENPSHQPKAWVEQISERPRAYVFHNFLSEDERKHLIKLAAPNMRRSLIVGPHGEAKASSIRTSHGAFLRRLQDPIVEAVERRIELWTHMPISHQEDIQVLRYAPGENYAAHMDTAYNKPDQKDVIRMATFLMYLSDVEEGGETAFPSPEAVWLSPQVEQHVASQGSASACTKGHVFAKAKAGDALLFYSFYPNKTLDFAAMHTGCTVLKGTKWSAPVWLHADPFRPDELGHKPLSHETQHDPGICADFHSWCPKWTEAGECTRNKDFMVGGDFSAGNCRKSCKACKVCDKGDWDCINANRKAAGFLELDRAEMERLGVGDFFEQHAAKKAAADAALFAGDGVFGSL